MNLNFKKLTLAALCLAATAQAAQTPDFYQHLGDMVLRAEESIAPKSQPQRRQAAQLVNALPKVEQQPEQLDLTVKMPTRAEQLKLWFSVLDQTDGLTILAKINTEKHHVIDFNVAEKLNLLSGTTSDKQHSLLTTLPTITVAGHTAAAEQLMLMGQEQQNQEVVRYFAAHPEELLATQRALRKIDAGMGLYLNFLQQKDDAHKAVFDQFYFQNIPGSAYLNKTTIPLAISEGFKHCARFIANTPPGSGFAALATGVESYVDATGQPVAYQAKVYGIDMPINLAKDLINTQIQVHSLATSGKDLWADNMNFIGSFASMSPLEMIKKYFQLIKNSSLATIGDNAGLYKNVMPNWLAWSFAITGRAFADYMYIYSLQRTYQEVQIENTIFDNMQIHLMGVAKIVEGFVELQAVAQKAQSTTLLNFVAEIEYLLAQADDGSDVGSLISNFLTKTFDGEPSYWSNRARILATHTLMQENRAAFVPALRAAGMVDALQAAAQLYLNHQNSTNHYCFIEFVDAPEPTVQLNNFWNPLMNAEQAVCNTVHLGSGGDRNMLLTGPNGSGKSVNMKGIALNIVFAQAFGIAAADRAVMTPFTVIETYLNEQEDLQQGLSTFMAEAKKLNDICKRIANLQLDQRAFVLMDEMLKGTVEDAGADEVYKAGKLLATSEKSIVLMATHFEKPTALEVDTNGGFVNYHVQLIEAVEPPASEFIRTFKLVRGANLWWFHDAAKRSRFISWLTALNQ